MVKETEIITDAQWKFLCSLCVLSAIVHKPEEIDREKWLNGLVLQLHEKADWVTG